MIAKISTGSFVFGMVNYNHSKLNQTINDEIKGIIVGSNLIKSHEFNDIVSAIKSFNNRNTIVEKPNLHISLSFHKDDILDNETIFKIAEDYMEEMNYSNQPYAVYRHFDKEHPHVHIVSSQINIDGKKINDSHIKRRSCAISRKLEDKYRITKAVEKKEIFDKIDLSKAVNEHLEEGKHSLTAIMKKILSNAFEKKPTNQMQLDRLLNEFQLVRSIVYDENKNPKGNYFDLRPLEYLLDEENYTKESNRINGSDLDPLLSYQNIELMLNNNKIEKEKLLRNIMGRVYFVINPILNNYKDSLVEHEFINRSKLSDLIIQLKKKGIELEVKRSQTGENPNTIYGLLFKDIKEGHTYSASELKIKTKDFLLSITDDMKNLTLDQKMDLLKEEKEEKEEKNKNPFNTPDADNKDSNIDTLTTLLNIVSERSHNNQENPNPFKKRKRRRRR